jgi:hypothetical protein
MGFSSARLNGLTYLPPASLLSIPIAIGSERRDRAWKKQKFMLSLFVFVVFETNAIPQKSKLNSPSLSV